MCDTSVFSLPTGLSPQTSWPFLYSAKRLDLLAWCVRLSQPRRQHCSKIVKPLQSLPLELRILTI